jgi:5-methylcytosine-specific restriction protein A
MTRRRRLSRLQRIGVFDRAGGVCVICKLEIKASLGERFIIEHIKPLWLGGADDETNMGPAHERCAIQTTAGEAPVKAKGDRIRAKHLGVKKRRRTIPGRRFNGEPIPARWVEG